MTRARLPATASDDTLSDDTLSDDTLSDDTVFARPDEARCDACSATLPENDEEGYSVPGRGVYLWVRGGEARLEDVPLCASCASAIGMTALARWEIEEEEG